MVLNLELFDQLHYIVVHKSFYKHRKFLNCICETQSIGYHRFYSTKTDKPMRSLKRPKYEFFNQWVSDKIIQ